MIQFKMKYMKVILIFLGIKIYAVFCFDPCSTINKLVTEMKSNADCGKDFFYVPNGNPVHKCFPRCVPKYDLKTTPCSDSNPCPQGYICPPKIKEQPTYCKADGESCFRYYINNEKGIKWENAWWKPDCLPDGTWAPKQCKGEQKNGRCFCHDAKGNRIFGESITHDSADMYCGCSRERSEQSLSQPNDYSTIHCDSKGNYELLQCSNGFCKCVDPKSGENTSKVVSEGMMKLLPCYDEIKIGQKYLRQCDSENYGIYAVLKTLKAHGTDHVNFSPLLCDGDGTYGPYRIERGVVYCTWKDNSPIEGLAAAIDENSDPITCNCARDLKVHQLKDETLTLACATNGNYIPEQQIDGQWFCVDEDGFRKSDFFSTRPTNCKKLL